MKSLIYLTCGLAAPLATSCTASSPGADFDQQHMEVPDSFEPSVAFQWMNVMLEAAADGPSGHRDV